MKPQTKQLKTISDKNNVTWFNGLVSPEDREKLHRHRGAVVWFTGLSASGKSTIAHIVEKRLYEQGCSTAVAVEHVLNLIKQHNIIQKK